jgi:hypothetical protein
MVTITQMMKQLEKRFYATTKDGNFELWAYETLNDELKHIENQHSAHLIV